MGIAEILVYIALIVSLTIYIHFEKRRSYREGFQDGIKHYSDLVDNALHHINRFNRKAEDAEIDIRAYLESINPLNKKGE